MSQQASGHLESRTLAGKRHSQVNRPLERSFDKPRVSQERMVPDSSQTLDPPFGLEATYSSRSELELDVTELQAQEKCINVESATLQHDEDQENLHRIEDSESISITLPALRRKHSAINESRNQPTAECKS